MNDGHIQCRCGVSVNDGHIQCHCGVSVNDCGVSVNDGHIQCHCGVSVNDELIRCCCDVSVIYKCHRLLLLTYSALLACDVLV